MINYKISRYLKPVQGKGEVSLEHAPTIIKVNDYIQKAIKKLEKVRSKK